MATLLSVNSYFYRRDGSEALFIEHNRLLAERGWRVVPFAMHHPQNSPSEWSEYFVSELEFGRDYNLAQKLSRVPKVIYSLEARRKIARLIAAAKPDIAHCHSVYHHISPSILSVLRRLGVPTVMTLHDLKLACPAYHMFNRGKVCELCARGNTYNVVRHRCIKGSVALSGLVWLESVVHRLLDSYGKNVNLFISPCRFYIDKLVQWGWPRDSFVHVPNFVDTRVTKNAVTSGRDFLYFGRLSPEKGLLTLIAAAARAGVRLRIAGTGPQEEELRRKVTELGADAEFTGHLRGARLTDAISAARATVLPAECYENAPMSVLESFVLGKPVVGARIGGIPELIENEVTGWTFASGSVDELADVLCRVQQMPDRTLIEMGERSRQLAEHQFSERAYIARLGEIYRRFGVVI
jgi:glycosyltransferase involved in cell wall biosynthesis